MGPRMARARNPARLRSATGRASHRARRRPGGAAWVVRAGRGRGAPGGGTVMVAQGCGDTVVAAQGCGNVAAGCGEARLPAWGNAAAMVHRGGRRPPGVLP